MPDLEFWSLDRKFGLILPETHVSLLLKMCAQSKPHETGGILVGFYTTAHDRAVVTAVSRAPSDSRHGRTHFLRGVRGLQRWIDYLWRRKHHYYLGEWHFHPSGLPRPSFTDTEQMQEFAASTDYQCPEPLLVIVGGTPPDNWTTNVYVFPRGGEMIQLFNVSGPSTYSGSQSDVRA